MERIGLHKMVFCNAKAIISTVKLGVNNYETMVMYEDGEEIESFRTSTESEAKAKHNETMNKWNDKIYDDSIDKCLGFSNLGQFVKPIVTC